MGQAITAAPGLLFDTVRVRQVPGSGESAVLAGSQQAIRQMVPVDRLLWAVRSLGHGLWEALAYWTISIFATEGVPEWE